MRGPGRLTRRRLIGASAAGGAAAAVGSSSLQKAFAAPAFLQTKPKVTYWGGLIFSDDANNLLQSTITQWGKDNNVDTEVVMINQNETNQKVSAAVESGTMPDALDLGLDLLLLLSNQKGILAPLDDLYKKNGDAQGGWYDSLASSTDTTSIAGGRTGIPFGASGNLLLRRNDALTA